MRPLFLYTLGFVATLPLVSVVAHADRFQVHASACSPQDSGVAYLVTGIGGVGNSHATASRQLVCPLIHNGASAAHGVADEGDNFDYGNATAAYVDVYDRNDDVSTGVAWAQACITYDSGSGSCGAADATDDTFTGHVRLTPSVSAWTSALTTDEFPFIIVSLPDQDSAGNSVLLGLAVISS